MKLALMQPYLFPYLGYYQLVHAVDEFIFYDDAAFIKQGYINRNQILLQDHAQRFSLQVHNASSFRKINEHLFGENQQSILALITQAYKKKSPFYHDVFPLIQSVFDHSDRRVEQLCAKSILSIFEYLGLSPKFSFSSSLPIPTEFRSTSRIIEICKQKNASTYINSIGGKSLYTHEIFSQNQIQLKFLQMNSYTYDQGMNDFTPHLSIIDMLMFCSKNEIVDLLNQFELVS